MEAFLFVVQPRKSYIVTSKYHGSDRKYSNKLCFFHQRISLLRTAFLQVPSSDALTDMQSKPCSKAQYFAEIGIIYGHSYLNSKQ